MELTYRIICVDEDVVDTNINNEFDKLKTIIVDSKTPINKIPDAVYSYHIQTVVSLKASVALTIRHLLARLDTLRSTRKHMTELMKSAWTHNKNDKDPVVRCGCINEYFVDNKSSFAQILSELNNVPTVASDVFESMNSRVGEEMLEAISLFDETITEIEKIVDTFFEIFNERLLPFCNEYYERHSKNGSQNE